MYIFRICDDECGYYTINKINKKQQALPSVFTQTLGKATIFLFTGKRVRRVHLLRHSAKFETLPSARRVALGKEPNFAECQCGSTRQSSKLRRVLPAWHSAKFESLPSATRLALGKVFDPVSFGCPVRPVRSFHSPVCLFVRLVSTFFAECGLAHGEGLPSAREKALGKAGFAGRRKVVCASPSATLGKEVAECFSAFAECL